MYVKTLILLLLAGCHYSPVSQYQIDSCYTLCERLDSKVRYVQEYESNLGNECTCYCDNGFVTQLLPHPSTGD